MMTGVLYVARQVILVSTAPVHSVITVMAMATSPRIVQRKFPLMNTMTGHTPKNVTTKTIETEPSPVITDAAKEDALTSQDHTTDLAMAEAPSTIGDTHPTPHCTTAATHDTNPLKDALGDTLTGTQCTSTTLTHVWHTTLLARVTLMTILWTEANQVQDTLILPTDCICGRHWSHIHGKQPLIDLSFRRRSLFRTHNWTFP